MTSAALPSPIRVLIVDDQPIVRASLRTLVDGEPDLQVVADVGDGSQGLEAAARLRPDVVLMDVRMPGLDGIAATRQLVASPAPPAVLILTTFELDEYIFGALQAGACGFLLKDSDPQQLVDAVRIAHRGDMVLAPSTTRRVIEAAVRTAPAAGSGGTQPPVDRLSERELQVFVAIARGLSNVEIASLLFVAENTVKTHVSNILTKLGFTSRIQVVIAAYEWQVVQAGRTGDPVEDPLRRR
jgi:DNA-binding NarL/FixJ family response regulator